ncbi:putative quinol monooxygenase [Arthrobacter sp. NPDC080031]|uniref:putative quinol monooxygenase n=1 Tax=Arthrobacter sp. NPDC080031 TaxID=3155918 RepID=UPI00344CF278
MSVVVTATVRPKPEHREEVIALFERAVARVHVEDPGCELYALHESAEGLLMIEKWTDAAALDAHSRAAAVVELEEGVEGLLERPTAVQIYTARPAGNLRQGRL